MPPPLRFSNSIEAAYLQWSITAAPPREAQRCLSLAPSGFMEKAIHLAPFLRAEPCYPDPELDPGDQA